MDNWEDWRDEQYRKMFAKEKENYELTVKTLKDWVRKVIEDNVSDKNLSVDEEQKNEGL